MNMSHASLGRSSSNGYGRSVADAKAADESRWHDLVTQISVEIAAPLTAALERVHALATTGRIDGPSLRALRDEVERARQAGMIGQQLARFASGAVRQSHERLQLAQIAEGVLAQRARETQARGITLKQLLKPVEVIVDASLLFSLLNTLLDWALANARSHIELRVDMQAVARARAADVPVRPPAADHADDTTATRSSAAAGLDSLAWRLVQQTAWTMGLVVERHDDAGESTLSIDFPRTVSDAMEGVSTIELDQGFAPSSNSKPLAGNHVLVVASRRDMRARRCATRSATWG